MSDPFRPGNPDASKLPSYEWKFDGSFKDIHGRNVRAHDDVVLTRDIPVDGEEGGRWRIPAGTIATVLFYQAEPDGVAHLECYWPEDGFSFGWERTDHLKFYMSSEEKYPR